MHAEPTEEAGTLREQSFSLLLIRALDHRWTGTLIIEPPFDMVHLIELDRGLTSRVLVPDDYARLGEILVDAGVIMESELDLALERGGLLGNALKDLGVIDQKMLERALVLQVMRRLMRVFDLPGDTQWSYSPDLAAFEGMPDGVRVDTLRVLWAGISAHGEVGGFLETALERIGDSPFQVRAGARINRFGFTGDAARLVGLINAQQVTLDELYEAQIAPKEVIEGIVYLLAITRYLDFSPVGDDVDSATSISAETTSDDDGTVGQAPTGGAVSSDEPVSSNDEAPRRVARIKLRRMAVRGGAAPDPPGKGDRSKEIRALPKKRRRASRDRTQPSLSSNEEVLAEVQRRLEAIDHATPFDLLEIDPAALRAMGEDAADEWLWDAYERASRRWHPDNSPVDVAAVEDGMRKIHEAISDAYATIADPELREALLIEALGEDEPVSSGRRPRSPVPDDDVPPSRPGSVTMPARQSPSTPRPRIPTPMGVPRFDVPVSQPRPESSPPSSQKRQGHLPPNELHEKSLVALAQQRMSEALRLCLLACAASPDNPDYAATSVWIRASMPRPNLDVLLLDLDDLLAKHAEHVAARYYRGVLRRRAGMPRRAKQDFEAVLELEPEHGGASQQLEELGDGRDSTA